jgi:16S rRNA (cytosine967-C5)-methyltransferase
MGESERKSTPSKRGDGATGNRARRIRDENLNARRVAWKLLEAVANDDAYANLLLPKMMRESGLSVRDAAFAQELAFGTLRWRGFYDSIIKIGAKRSVEEIDTGALNAIRLGCHQLLGMRVPTHAAISESVNIARAELSLGSVGFVNGVLRRVAERNREDWLVAATENLSDPIAKLAISTSHPEWIVRALEKALEADGRADDLEALLEATTWHRWSIWWRCLGKPPSRSYCEKAPFSVVLAPSVLSGREVTPSSIGAVRGGRVRVQDQGSQLAALAMIAAEAVKPNEEWLDLCAGPGGKAALFTPLLSSLALNLPATRFPSTVLDWLNKRLNRSTQMFT